MKIKRMFAAVSAVMVASAALSGCTGNAAGNADGSLTLYTYEEAGAAALLEQQLENFTEETGIEVDVNNVPGTGAAVYPGKLRTALAGGKGPDVWRIWGGSLGQPFASDGLALDLKDYWDEYQWDELFPQSAKDAMSVDGATYGIPVVSNRIVAWYSKSAFEEAGIAEEPSTYEELVAANEKLVAAGIVPFGTGGELGWHVMRLFEYLLEKNAGPELHDQLLAGTADWDAPQVVQAFAELKEWSDQGWLPEGVMGLDPSQEEAGFTQGKYAYTIAGGWGDTEYVQRASDPSDYGVFALPTDQDPIRQSGWVEGYMINGASPNKDNAAKLLDWLAQPETLKALGVGNTPVVGAEPDAAQYPLSAEVAEIAATSPFYTIQDQAFPAELSNSYFEVQSQVIQGQLSPEDAAEKLQQLVPAGLQQ